MRSYIDLRVGPAPSRTRPSCAAYAPRHLGPHMDNGHWLILEQCVLIELHCPVQDPQHVRNFPRAFKGKVKSASQRRQQQREELAGLLRFAESNACLDSRQITAVLRIQNPPAVDGVRSKQVELR